SPACELLSLRTLQDAHIRTVSDRRFGRRVHLSLLWRSSRPTVLFPSTGRVVGPNDIRKNRFAHGGQDEDIWNSRHNRICNRAARGLQQWWWQQWWRQQFGRRAKGRHRGTERRR